MPGRSLERRLAGHLHLSVSPGVHVTIQLFNNGEFELSVEYLEDTFRVYGPHLATALAMRDGSALARGLDDDEKVQVTPAHASVGRADQQVWWITEPGFFRAVSQRQAARIKEDGLRERVERFQRWVFHEVLPAIRKHGGYVSPGATLEQRAAILGINEAQARVLHALNGIVDPTWLESKARHLAARALGEEPEEDPAKRLLTVGEYLEERGVTATAARKLAPTFGKRLKALYLARHGEPPGKSRRFVDGAQRDVAVYTEADRDLFDAVWSELTDDAAA
jgi:prophage antirepressor-like protein